MKTVVYICDRKKPCNSSPSCGCQCRYTADPAYAKNGPTFDAENDPRFEDLDGRYWWEKEVSDDGRNKSTDQGDGQGNS